MQRRRAHLDEHIRPSDAHERSSKDRQHRQRRPEPPSPVRLPSALEMERVVQPEEARHAIGVPRREERRRYARQVREDRDGAGEDERDGRGREAQRGPR